MYTAPLSQTVSAVRVLLLPSVKVNVAALLVAAVTMRSWKSSTMKTSEKLVVARRFLRLASCSTEHSKKKSFKDAAVNLGGEQTHPGQIRLTKSFLDQVYLAPIGRHMGQPTCLYCILKAQLRVKIFSNPYSLHSLAACTISREIHRKCRRNRKTGAALGIAYWGIHRAQVSHETQTKTFRVLRGNTFPVTPAAPTVSAHKEPIVYYLP